MRAQLNNKHLPKEKILNATLKIIGTRGVQHVTSRSIAALADVNVAAINYYFGGKNKVVNEALKTIAQTLLLSFKHLDELSLPAEVRLRNCLYSYADYAILYPDVFRNFIDQIHHDPEASCEYIEFLRKNGLAKLKTVLKEITGTEDENQLSMIIFQIFSCLEFPVLLGPRFNSLANFNYYDRDCRYRYIDLVIKSLVKN